MQGVITFRFFFWFSRKNGRATGGKIFRAYSRLPSQKFVSPYAYARRLMLVLMSMPYVASLSGFLVSSFVLPCAYIMSLVRTTLYARSLMLVLMLMSTLMWICNFKSIRR